MSIGRVPICNLYELVHYLVWFAIRDRDFSGSNYVKLMNATIESLFGPPSEPIDIPAFIQAATAIPIEEDNAEESLSVADECDVSDIRDNLSKTWNSPRLSAHLSNNHNKLLVALSSTTKAARTKRKAQLQDSLDLPPDIATLQDHLGAVKLSCWKCVN